MDRWLPNLLIPDGGGEQEFTQQLMQLPRKIRPVYVQELLGITEEDIKKKLSNKGTALVGEHIALLALILTEHIENGRQEIIVNNDMAELLALTEINLPLSEIRPPYSCCYVHIDGDVGMRIWGGERTGWHMLEGGYSMQTQFVGDTNWGLFMCAKPNTNSENKVDDATFWMPFFKSESDMIVEDILRKRLETAPDPVIEKGSKLPKDVADMCSKYEFVDTKDTWEINKFNLTLAFRIMLNTFLYMSSKDATIRRKFWEDKALKKKLRKVGRASRRQELEMRLNMRSSHYIYIGNGDEKMAERNVNINRESGEVRRHVVRGHWHTYWVGKGRANSERKWIRPYWRGAGEVVPSRSYKIKGGTS
ncbi:MAG: hypothetical protein GXP49_05610 [Deltaproteobacteria bacterium]|nr:hypothetical protein [Deltaproteobacteria bacterium]